MAKKQVETHCRKELWLGDEEAHQELIAIRQKVSDASPELVKKASDYDDEEHDSHWMVDIDGSVATISIVGPMEKGRAGVWGLWFGFVGYDDIKEAINSAIKQGASKFILDWATPGGTVDGIADMEEFLKEFVDEYEVVSFTSDRATSGGLWLATIADEFYATAMAQVGSLGVIAVHTEVKDMLDAAGITKTVFRSAPNKALGSPYEKLTKKAEDKIKEDLAVTHEFFIDAIVRNTGMPRDYVATEIATGDVWYGADALAKGLIDGVKSYKEVFIALSGESEENTSNYQNSLGVDMKHKVISAKTQAAIASGVPVDVALENEQDVTTEEEETTSTEETSSTDETEEVEGTEEEASTATETKPVVADAGLSQLIMDLTSQLADAKTKLSTAEAQLTKMSGTHDSMKKVVVQSIQRGQVALGSPAADTEALMGCDASVLVQQHAQVDAQLSQRFPIGGRVTSQVEESSSEDQTMAAVLQRNEQILLDLARFKK
jgi:signal peptide peptidase SppA